MRLYVLALIVPLGACWRGSPQPEPPQRSFVARVNALGELRRGTAALAQSTQSIMHRIHGLASEAEREALLADVIALEHEVMRLAAILDRARDDGHDPRELGELAHKLEHSMFGVGQLRAELRHARTTAEIEAFEELKRKLEGMHDSGNWVPGPRGRILVPRDRGVPPILLPGDPRVPPDTTPLQP
jgi:hypothetical protein